MQMQVLKFKKIFVTLLLSSFFVCQFSFGQDVQNFIVTDTDGNQHNLYTDFLDEGRVVVIKLYWAGCPPCNATAKDVQEMYVRWEEGNGVVEFLALATQNFEDDDDTKGYISRHGITFPMVSPDGNSLDAINQFDFFGTPTYIIASPDRSMIFDPGGLTAVESAIQTAVDALVAVPDCPTTPVTISSNEELATFQSTYPNCTSLAGNLTIDGSVSDLKAFENIETINGSLIVRTNALADLSDLVALSNISGDIIIENSPELQSLTGLERIRSFSGSIELRDLPSLSSLRGLRNLQDLDGDLLIRQLDALEDLDGLDNLRDIAGDLSIVNNRNLTSLDGLEQLRQIDGNLEINSNDVLESLVGIEDLSLFSSLDIINNDQLSECAISSLCGLIGGDLAIPADIRGNATGCQSVEDVNNACNPSELPTSFSVQVLDAFDNPVQGIRLVARSATGEIANNTLGTTDPDGLFSFELPNQNITSFDDDLILEYEAPADAFVSGITVVDLVRIQRHILGLEVITNPFIQIAADANGNGTVSATDLVFMINVILGNRTGFDDGNVYRIVTEDCTLGDSNCDSSDLIRNPGNSDQIRLRAIKIGDIRE